MKVERSVEEEVVGCGVRWLDNQTSLNELALNGREK